MDAAESEAKSLGEYLIGVTPSPRVRAVYAEAQIQMRIGNPTDRFDVLLLRLALLGPLSARSADIYARVFRPNAWLRRKLILLLALVEVHGSDAHILGRPVSSGPLTFFLGAALRGTLSVVTFALSFPFLGLSHLALGGRRGTQ